MGFRLAAKKDKNHADIVRGLRALYFRVDDVAQLKNLYDLVVTGTTITGDVRTVRVELKSENGKLTTGEAEYHAAEPYPHTLIIAKSIDDILRWFGRVK